MKHLLPMRLPALLVVLLAVGGCGQLKPSTPRTSIQTVAALNQTYISTLNTIERLHDFGFMTDEARLALQPDIDQAEFWRLKLNDAALSGSVDEPFSDYRKALDQFNEYLDAMVRAQIEAEKTQKTVQRVKTKAVPSPEPADAVPSTP